MRMNTMDDNLYNAISDFLESCHRTGHHDLDENLGYFLRENDINVDEEIVVAVFEEVDSSY